MASESMQKRGEAAMRALKYVMRLNPSVWQLPNALKIHEFKDLTGPVPFARGQQILDLGCGRGIQSQLLAARGPRVLGVDPGEKYVRNAEYELRRSWVRSRVRFQCGTVETMRLPAASFDYVFSFCVLEHIPNLAEVLAELHRLIKPGGQMHVTVDSLSNIDDPAIIERHRVEYKVQQYFSPERFEAVLQSAGFELRSWSFILAGDIARQEMVRGLLEDDTSCPQNERPRAYARLLNEERSIVNPTSGLMILGRATKV